MNSKEIKQLIASYDKDQLESIILSITTKNQAAQKILLEYCKNKEKDPATPNYNLIIETQLNQYWMTAAQIIEEFDTYGGGPDRQMNIAANALKKLQALGEENNISWSLLKPIVDEMIKFIISDNSGFSDYLMDIVYDFCEIKEKKRYLAEIWEQCKGSYYKNLAAEIFLELGEKEKYLELKRKSLEEAGDYIRLAKYYKQELHDEEKALSIMKMGLEQKGGDLNQIYKYLFQYYKKIKDEVALEKLYKKSAARKYGHSEMAEMMYEYYCEKNDYKKKKEVLLQMVWLPDFRHFQKLYSECKKELSKEDFENEERKILRIIEERDLRLYLDILLEKGETDKVLEYLMNYRCSDREHYFTERLKGKYPREVLKLYWEEVVRSADSMTKDYPRAVKVLREIKQIMKDNGWMEEWIMQYNEFREKNRRKKSLMALLEDL